MHGNAFRQHRIGHVSCSAFVCVLAVAVSACSKPPAQAGASRTSTSAAPQGMVWIEGGTFVMGSDTHYPEEGPAQEIRLDGFWMDAHEVSNEHFAQFVQATGYLTVAERAPNPSDYPELAPELLKPGSAVFAPPESGAVSNVAHWWQFVEDANWRQPLGSGSDLHGREQHPVVHIAYEDALAYARWAGRSLPSEAQWEYAARLSTTTDQNSRPTANTWQGNFPFSNSEADGYIGTAPVGSFHADPQGLFDMLGNVWEWTGDHYQGRHASQSDARNPTGPASGMLPGSPNTDGRVIKGGSYLCAPNFCMRYRASARQAADSGLGTSHIGLRTVLNVPASASVPGATDDLVGRAHQIPEI